MIGYSICLRCLGPRNLTVSFQQNMILPWSQIEEHSWVEQLATMMVQWRVGHPFVPYDFADAGTLDGYS